MAVLFPPGAPSVRVPVTVVGPRHTHVFTCVIDTGAERTVLSASALLLLGFDLKRPVGRANLRSATGHALVPLLSASAVAALGRVRTDFVVAAHDFPLGVSADGLLGLDFFRGFVLTLDFHRGRAGLNPPRRWWQFWK
jgi:hypothetical protein